MINDPDERLAMSLIARDLVIPLSRGDEKRIRMFMDRMNRDCEIADVDDVDLDPDDDLDVAAAVITCMDEGIRMDEREHGVESTPWGDMRSVDVAAAEMADEMAELADVDRLESEPLRVGLFAWLRWHTARLVGGPLVNATLRGERAE
jgi:hypothetical protein